MVNGTVQLPLVCTAATAARIDDPGVSLRWIMAIPMQPKPTELKPLPPRHLYEINTACVVSVIPEACRYLPVAGEARQVLP